MTSYQTQEMRGAIESSLDLLSADDVFSVPDRGSRRKWDGPWWHMATLCEMGESELVPSSAVGRACELLKRGAWPRFVITKEDAPMSNADRSKMDCCHCELGVFYMTLAACGCDVDEELPWIREWFLSHQLPDGGLNCSPSAYRKSRKSSVVSTLPPLEAILLYTNREFTDAEARFLDDGARYLIEHRLVCTKKDGRVINGEWLKPMFPRFFEYDILRGLNYLVAWAERREQALKVGTIEEGLQQLDPYVADGRILVGRHVNDKNSDWSGRTFPLLKVVSEVAKHSPYLKKELDTVQGAVRAMIN